MKPFTIICIIAAVVGTIFVTPVWHGDNGNYMAGFPIPWFFFSYYPTKEIDITIMEFVKIHIIWLLLITNTFVWCIMTVVIPKIATLIKMRKN